MIPGRAAYPQLRDFYKQAAIEQHGADQTTAADLAATHIDHHDEPRSEVFFARLADRGVGLVNLVTLGQIGVIEWLYTAAEARNQGVATTLLAHALDHCRRALFEQVILEVTDDNLNAIRLYDSLGFKPATSFIQYQLSDR